MVEFFTQYITWWHWVVLGILFIILEMATGTFIVLGFGIAAVLVGLLDLIFGLNFLAQVTLWILCSITIIAVSFKYFKDQPTVSSSGQSNHGFDTLGTVTQAINTQTKGRVKFDNPVLGNTIWHASADQTLNIGDRVTIEEVNGQYLKVTPVPTSNTSKG